MIIKINEYNGVCNISGKCVINIYILKHNKNIFFYKCIDVEIILTT